MSAEESLLKGICVDADQATQIATGVQSDAIKSVAAAFAKNVTRIRNTLSMPLTATEVAVCLVGIGGVVWRIWRSEPVQQAYAQLTTGAQDGTSVSIETIWKELLEPNLSVHLLKEELQGAADELTKEDFPNKLVASLQQVERVREWIEGQLANTTSTAWTAFECLATDLWVAALNAMPMKFYQGVIRGQGTGDKPEGLSTKQISIGLLAKYQFDLRGHLGTLLKPKFDLTSLTNIRSAYEAAFGKCKELDGVFKDQDLHLLEASRHVIVHRAGVVDAEFVARTKNMGIAVEEGKPLPLTGQEVSGLVNAAIQAGSAILGFVDAKLVADSASPVAETLPALPGTARKGDEVSDEPATGEKRARKGVRNL